MSMVGNIIEQQFILIHKPRQVKWIATCNVTPSGGESWRVCPMNLQVRVQNIP